MQSRFSDTLFSDTLFSDKSITAARILSPSLNIGIRGGLLVSQLVEEYKTFVCLQEYLNA